MKLLGLLVLKYKRHHVPYLFPFLYLNDIRLSTICLLIKAKMGKKVIMHKFTKALSKNVTSQKIQKNIYKE